jgi:hypothetical protein
VRRLYFLLPDVECARKVVDELLVKRVEERHIHLLARRGTPLEDLPQTSVAQRTDLIPALERGIAVGGATGALAGLVAVTVPPAGLVLGGGAVLAMALAGAGFGAWAASMLGVSTPNSQIRRFEDAIERGEILMMVDVPKHRVHDIEQLIRAHHPEVEIGGTEPTIPPFP